MFWLYKTCLEVIYIYGLAIICSCVPTVPPISDIMSVYYNHEINRAFALKVCLWAGIAPKSTHLGYLVGSFEPKIGVVTFDQIETLSKR